MRSKRYWRQTGVLVGHRCPSCGSRLCPLGLVPKGLFPHLYFYRMMLGFKHDDDWMVGDFN